MVISFFVIARPRSGRGDPQNSAPFFGLPRPEFIPYLIRNLLRPRNDRRRKRRWQQRMRGRTTKRRI